MDQDNFFKSFYKRLREAASDDEEWFKNLDKDLNDFYASYKKEVEKNKKEPPLELDKNLDKELDDFYAGYKKEKTKHSESLMEKAEYLFEAIFGYDPNSNPTITKDQKKFIEFYFYYFHYFDDYPLFIKIDKNLNSGINSLITQGESSGHYKYNYFLMQCNDYYKTTDKQYKFFLKEAKKFSNIIPSKEFPVKIYKSPVNLYTLREERLNGIDVRKKYKDTLGYIMFIDNFENLTNKVNFIHVMDREINHKTINNDYYFLIRDTVYKFFKNKKVDLLDILNYPESIRSIKDFYDLTVESYNDIINNVPELSNLKFEHYCTAFLETLSHSKMMAKNNLYLEELTNPSQFMKYPLQVFHIDNLNEIGYIEFFV